MAIGDYPRWPVQSTVRETILLPITVTFGASSAVSATEAPSGCSVAKTDTGKWTVTVPGSADLKTFVTAAPAAGGLIHARAVKAADPDGGTVIIEWLKEATDTTAVADPGSGDQVHILCVARRVPS